MIMQHLIHQFYVCSLEMCPEHTEAQLVERLGPVGDSPPAESLCCVLEQDRDYIRCLVRYSLFNPGRQEIVPT